MIRAFSLALLVAVCGLVQSASATVLSSRLTFNGQTDQVNTINNPVGRSTFIDGSNGGNLAGVLDDGDIVFGWIGSTQTTTDVSVSVPFNPTNPVNGTPAGTPISFGANQYAVAVFAGVVNGAGLSSSGQVQTFITAAASGSGFSLAEMFPTFSALSTAANGVVAVFSGSSAGGVNDLKNLVNTGGSTFSGLINSTNFELDFALTAAPSGFLQSRQIVTDPGDPVEFRQRAGLNVIASTVNSSYAQFIKVPVAPLFGAPITSADMALDNTNVAAAPQNGFLFQTQNSSIRINPIPEPTSLATFFGLSALGLIKLRRRSK